MEGAGPRAARASAPGSLMLMGEHSVLRGQPALVCAIDRRITVEITPREDDVVRLHSGLGEHETRLGDWLGHDRFRFVIGALRACRKGLEAAGRGFELDVRSGMSHKMGLGSSAAVTVATLAAVAGMGCAGDEAWDETTGAADPAWLERTGREVVRKVQGGRGSGADVAASAWGGVLRYFMSGEQTLKLPVEPELTLLFSGYKTPTPEVIALVEEARGRDEEVFDAVDELVGQVVRRATEAAVAGDLETVGRMMNVNHGLMDAMGVNDAKLSELAYALREDPNVWGSKISGAGLGDCVVGLGKAMRRDFGALELDVKVEGEGARREEVSEGAGA